MWLATIGARAVAEMEEEELPVEMEPEDAEPEEARELELDGLPHPSLSVLPSCLPLYLYVLQLKLSHVSHVLTYPLRYLAIP